MIDVEREQLLTLTEASKYVADAFGGGRPSQNTMARWCLRGLRGRKLESLKRGRQRLTSKEAVVRFFQRSAEPQLAPVVPTVNAARQAEVERQLIARGM